MVGSGVRAPTAVPGGAYYFDGAGPDEAGAPSFPPSHAAPDPLPPTRRRRGRRVARRDGRARPERRGPLGAPPAHAGRLRRLALDHRDRPLARRAMARLLAPAAG